MKKDTIYAYVKGNKYENYSVTWKKHGIENKTFETKEEFLNYVIANSNYDSVPVQFYC